MFRGTKTRLTVAAVMALATAGIAAGCGSSGGSSTTSTTLTATPNINVPVDQQVAAQVPADIKSNGTLTVAADATYAPNEFIASNGSTVIGMDADLAKALAQAMGLQATVKNVTFDSIIPGLAANKYDLGMSSFTITKEREKTVDFVSYAIAGTSFYVNADGGPDIQSLADLCGAEGRRGARNHPGGGRHRAGQEVHRCRQAGGLRPGLPRPERGQSRTVERSRRRRHGGLAARRLRGGAV